MSTGILVFYVLSIVLYLVATLFFGETVRDKHKHGKVKSTKAGKNGITLTIIGFATHIIYFILRWIASGHAPVSNMFEFVTFLGMSIVFAFIILYFIYKLDILGLFALPVALVILAYASMFPTDISPLVPSLQSPWLYIHVTTVSLAQGILAISFVAGLIYLLATINQTVRSKKTFWLEAIIVAIFLVIGFVISSSVFNIAGYEVEFEYTENVQGQERLLVADYHMPPIVGVQSEKNPTTITPDKMEPLMTTPNWMKGADSARKLNTVLWSVVVGCLLYIIVCVRMKKNSTMITNDKMDPLITTHNWMKGSDSACKLNTVLWSVVVGGLLYIIARLIIRKRVGAWVKPYLRNINTDLVDEVVYRSVAIGFPVFALGGLIFASIWAQIAWDRFWGWDPKEVWALITFLFYAVFLHLRLSRGWHGEKSAWLAVIGFTIIMFNIIVVNLVLAGLHSYA